MVTVHFPASLRPLAGETVRVSEAVATLGELLAALDRSRPGLAAALDDPLFNIAINQALVLHDVDRQPLKDGDEVEIVPTMAGG